MVGWRSAMSLERPLVRFESRWDVKDVAAYFKCSRSWVYKAAEKGWLPCERYGSLLRFDPDAIRSLGKSASAVAARLSTGTDTSSPPSLEHRDGPRQ
jgi:excisionase family DNA binding protein